MGTSVSMSRPRARELIKTAQANRILVLGDVILDQFIWGRVRRISPEAPVPIVEFERESYIPGGAANVARNLAALGVPVSMVGVVGRDAAGKQVKQLLQQSGVEVKGLLEGRDRVTSIKSRIVAHQQQVVRLDREEYLQTTAGEVRRLKGLLLEDLEEVGAVIVGDYGKGLVTQDLLSWLKDQCRERGVWLSLDPKPIHRLDLSGLSLITPNRKEAFELVGMEDRGGNLPPLKDEPLREVASRIMETFAPALLLVTLGDKGMLLCRRGLPPWHIPTVAQEVFDVSGAGDTVIASFTMAIVGEADPVEAAVMSNHAAGVVVGKVGTATVGVEELLNSFESL